MDKFWYIVLGIVIVIVIAALISKANENKVVEFNKGQDELINDQTNNIPTNQCVKVWFKQFTKNQCREQCIQNVAIPFVGSMMYSQCMDKCEAKKIERCV